MKEWQRTIILLAMIGVAIGFIIYLRTSYDAQAIQTLR
jgi:hypothetical protein